MKRCLEVAGEVVMLEFGGGEKDHVDRDGERCKASPTAYSVAYSH